MATYLPVNDCLKALKAAGHDVQKPRRRARCAGFGGPSYLIDGKELSLTGIRNLAAGLVQPKSTRKAADKPLKEIESIAAAVAANEWCKERGTQVGTHGERQLNGQIKYLILSTNSDGKKVRTMKTLAWIRDWATRNQVI